jgi:15-cis-phytoene synthase
MTSAIVASGALRLGRAEGRAVIRKHSKSFSLASWLLGSDVRDDAVALYAYCRRADDAIDLVPADQAGAGVLRLSRELDDIYAGRACSEPILAEFQRLVFEKGIPRAYPQALLEGFQADAAGLTYETLEQLYRYCWCVAGSVGAMMCHVTGVSRARAVVHGVHLGMAMQLTNICRDVAEDWALGRLYLPKEMTPGLEQFRAARSLPPAYLGVVARAVRGLLAAADGLYRSGDAGLPYLAFRSRLAVASARRLYSAIGQRILASGADALAGRAVVPGYAKVWQVARACATSVNIGAASPRFVAATLSHPIGFPEDVLPY